MSALPERIRKAAVLITALDQETADQLLDQMTPEQAQLVRNAALDLGEISRLETSQVIEEFLQSNSPASGVEIDPSLADKLTGTDDLVDVDPGLPAEPEQPFRFLHEAEPETLSDLLRWEHPQTIAVVLSHLPPSQGMQVLVHFTDSLQNQILQRMIGLENTNPKVIHNIEQELERLFARKIHSRSESAAGLLAVQAIFKQADAHHRQQLLKNMSSQDRQRLLGNQSSGSASKDQLAGKHRRKLADFLRDQQPGISPRMETLLEKIEDREKQLANQAGRMQPQSADTLPDNTTKETPPQVNTSVTPTSPQDHHLHFDQLSELGPDDLAKVLQNVEPQLLLLALMGASPELMNRITDPLPASDNKRLRQQMEQIGPLRLQDITTAQNLVIKATTQLMTRGEIQWPANSRFAATA
ncbi:MAG: FliG C-terminal domain-containing protein [Planctomycetota bacterium]|nr:FliG C-terminal domain-containing protein [Planctomycetota bacterium]